MQMWTSVHEQDNKQVAWSKEKDHVNDAHMDDPFARY